MTGGKSTMKYSSVKELYEVFGLENMNFEKFCWYLYKNGVITLKECTKYIRMEDTKGEVTVHELKILPEYFAAIVSGEKRFEIRKYITDFAQQDGYVVLGIK